MSYQDIRKILLVSRRKEKRSDAIRKASMRGALLRVKNKNKKLLIRNIAERLRVCTGRGEESATLQSCITEKRKHRVSHMPFMTSRAIKRPVSGLPHS